MAASAGKRGQAGEDGGASQAAERMLSVLLTEMDGLEAATGAPLADCWVVRWLRYCCSGLRCAALHRLGITNEQSASICWARIIC